MKHLLVLASIAFSLIPIPAFAQPVFGSRHYMLLSESYLLDDCPICGRPSIMRPLRGSFDFVYSQGSDFYQIENIRFSTPDYLVEGEGALMIDQVKKMQQANFTLKVKRGDEPAETLTFTNEAQEVSRELPMLDFSITETPGTLVRVYSIRVAAAPLKDLWFSTTDDFTAQRIAGAGPDRTGGDILAINGTVAGSYQALVQNFGLTNPEINCGIDAFSTNALGFIVSLGKDAPATPEPISNGDMITSGGQIMASVSELAAPLGFPPPSYPGLDVYYLLDGGKTYYSITNDLYSVPFRKTIFSGDIISSSGEVIKTGRDLLEKFLPSYLDPEDDYGLDSLFIWPSGEIWFSTESDFISQTTGHIWSGDLLSDKGYIVFRSRELLYAFDPAGDKQNFGLDGIMVFPDLPPPIRPNLITITKQGANITINWQGASSQYRLEKAATVDGPYQPITDWLPGTTWTGPASSDAGFFRVSGR